jgi:glycosyltransferase involved in cell wall biosynthesis
MDRSKLAILIPALNEEKSIGRIVSKILRYGVPIVIDDGSTDFTGKIALGSGAIVLKHEKNYGYDKALNTGFLYASKNDYEIIITIDADGQHDVNTIEKFKNEILNGADIVIGIRNSKPRIAEKIFSFISEKKWGILDPLCGLKAYKINVYKKLGHFDSYGSIGTELTIFAAKKRLRLKQIPIVVRRREKQDFARFGGALKANFLILKSLLKAVVHK